MYNWECRNRMHHRHGFRFPWLGLIVFIGVIWLLSGGWHHWGVVGGLFALPFLLIVPLIFLAPFILAAWFMVPHIKRWWAENSQNDWESMKHKRNEMFDSLFADEKAKRYEKAKRGDGSNDDIFYV